MGKQVLQPISESEVKAKMIAAAKEAAPPKPIETPLDPQGIVEPIVDGKLPEVKTEEKPAEVKLDDKGNPIVETSVEKPTRKKVKEVSKPFFKTEEKIVDPQEAATPDKFKEQLSAKDKEIAELRAIVNDPENQTFFEIRKAGGTAYQYLKESEGVNPDTIPLADLHAMDLKSQGLNDEEIAEEVAEFNTLSSSKQKMLTNSIKSKLKSEAENKKGEFLSKLTTHNKTQSEQSTAEQQKQQVLSDKLETDYNKLVDDYVGQEHYSVVGTPQMAESLKKLLKDPNGLIPKNEDGSLNAQVLFDLAHYRLFGDLRLENLENQYFAAGVEEIEKKIEARGDAGKIIRMPQGTPQQQNVDVERETFKSARPVSR